MKAVRQYFEKLETKPALKTKWLLLICLLLFVPHLFTSFGILQQSIMTDLNARIIGSRLLEANRSPFFYTWTTADGYRLFNPNNTLPHQLNGVTVTPFYLWLQLPLSRLDYCSIKHLWWMLQELLLFATLVFTCLIPVRRSRQLLVLIISTIFFLHSRNWLVHVYSGQYYIIFGFVFSLTAFLTLRAQKTFSSVVLFPLAALIRPFFALSVIPFLLKNVKKQATVLSVSAFLCVGLTLLSTNLKLWLDYKQAMNLYAQEITGMNSVPISNVITTVPEPCVERVETSKVFGAGCLFSIQHYLNLFYIKLNSTLLYTVFLIVTIITFVLVVGPKRISESNENMLLSSFLIYILSELFTPANRNPYNLIQYLGIMGVFMQRANLQLIALMILGLAFNHDFPVRLAYYREIGEMIILLTIFIALYYKKSTPDKPKPFNVQF